MWQEVLRLTDPGQKVFDLKGELLFRQRAYYYMFETVTGLRFERGLLKDDIPERLIEAHACVATIGKMRLPDRARRFIEDNYILVGPVLVAGKWLVPPAIGPASRPRDAGQVIRFTVEIPARYTILSAEGRPGVGLLDGQPLGGPRDLAAGPHEYRRAAGDADLALIWAQAAQRGYRPMDSLPPEWQ